MSIPSPRFVSDIPYVETTLKGEDARTLTFEIASYQATGFAPFCKLKDIQIDLTIDFWQLGGGLANETPIQLPAGNQTYTILYLDNDADGNVTAGDCIVLQASSCVVSYSSYTLTLRFLKLGHIIGSAGYPPGPVSLDTSYQRYP